MTQGHEASGTVVAVGSDVLVRGFVAPLLLIGFAAFYRLFTGSVYGMVLALTTSNVVATASMMIATEAERVIAASAS